MNIIVPQPNYLFSCLLQNNAISTSLLFISCAYINNPLLHNCKQKFRFLQTILENQYYTDQQKEEFLLLFQKCQRQIHGWNRLAFYIKRKKPPIKNATDLLMNPIEQHQRNVFSVVQDGAKYLFTIMDMIKVIETSLTNSPMFISEPLVIKNPYNNLPFSKAILYSVYFFMKQQDVVMSTLFHQYFLCNFNLNEFKNKNAVLIRDKAIENYVRNGDTLNLYKVCKSMIIKRNNNHRKKCHITIHDDFPKDRLVHIMKPCLRLFYTSLYSLDMNARYSSEEELDWRLNKLQQNHPLFGRKKISIDPITKRKTIIFQDEHTALKQHMNPLDYERSHLHEEEEDDDEEDEYEEEDEAVFDP